jgi:hypothetical protein
MVNTRKPRFVDVLRQYLKDVPAGSQSLVRELDALVRAADPRLVASLKWGNLTYHRTKNVCAIVTHSRHVNLQLWAGGAIADPTGLLEGSGRQMRHVMLTPGVPFNRKAVTALVKAASKRDAD